jgi:thiamine monophosphate synthase
MGATSGAVPELAIGDISVALLPGLMARGVGVAVVSAVMLAAHPRQATLHGLDIARNHSF